MVELHRFKMFVSPAIRRPSVVFASSDRHQASSSSTLATAHGPSLSHTRRTLKICRLASSSSSWVARVDGKRFAPSATSQQNGGYRPLRVTSLDSEPQGERIIVNDGKPVPILEEGFVSVLKIVTNLFPFWVSLH